MHLQPLLQQFVLSGVFGCVQKMKIRFEAKVEVQESANN